MRKASGKLMARNTDKKGDQKYSDMECFLKPLFFEAKYFDVNTKASNVTKEHDKYAKEQFKQLLDSFLTAAKDAMITYTIPIWTKGAGGGKGYKTDILWGKFTNFVYVGFPLYVSIQAIGNKEHTKAWYSVLIQWKTKEIGRIPKELFKRIDDKIKDIHNLSLGEVKEVVYDSKSKDVCHEVRFDTKQFAFNDTEYDDFEKKHEDAWSKEKQNMLKAFQEYWMIINDICFVINSPIIRAMDNEIEYRNCKQLVLTGAPGTGKTYSAKEYVKMKLKEEYQKEQYSEKEFEEEWKKEDKGVFGNRWRMVQFHPSFDYTDFVEGLRPAEVKAGKTKASTFVRMDGVFKAFCRKVVETYGEDGPKCYFIIDEINRADLSKVFGELMYCLEEDYRGKENGIKTQYANLPTYVMNGDMASPIPRLKDEFNEKFYIPKNIIIIGTMNDIDRSVDTFDFALRRRFKWININVDKPLLMSTFLAMRNIKAQDISRTIEDSDILKWVEAIINMNSMFNNYKTFFRTPEDYKIGPAYFKELFQEGTLETIFDNKVKPLLGEYVRGRDDMEKFVDECETALLKGIKEEDEDSVEELSEFDEEEDFGLEKDSISENIVGEIRKR